MAETVKLTVEYDPDKITEVIKEATDLENNKKVFDKLAYIAQIKKEIADMVEGFDKLEREVKYAINDRAKALYGKDWTVIAGEGFRVNRSFSGSVYEIIDAPPKQFVKVTTSPDTKAIDEYVKDKSKLPKGIALNEHRGESIRITVK